MTDSRLNFSSGDRWLLAGNFLSIASVAAIGIGTVLKLAAGPGLPSGKAAVSGYGQELGSARGTSTPHDVGARGYFSN